MNRVLGFMNVLLLALIISLLFFYGGEFNSKQAVLGAAFTFVPITFTMLALEPQARFLRTAIAMNALLIGLYFLGSGAVLGDPRNLFLAPFVLNIAGLSVVWVCRRREQQEAGYEAANLPEDRLTGATAAEPMIYDEPMAENYFVRHWRGQLSLPMSYWINVWGVTALCVGLILGATKLLQDAPLRWASMAALAAHVLLFVVGAWSTIGTWRSAGYHVARGGVRGWAVTVQVLIVLGAVGTVSNFFLYAMPQMKEHWLIAIDRDPQGRIETQLTRDGRALVLSGTLGAGSSSKVRSLLDQSPEVATLVLESPGGRLVEAVRIAKLIRERKLDTYVETHCESACTFIFLAGADRAATRDVRIGFHRAFFPGMSPKLDAAMTENMLKQYREAGLSDAFLARVRETQAADMWYPTHDELLEAHVVNRVSLGGEAAQVSKYESKAYLAFQYAGDPIMASINDRFRGAVDAAAAAAWERYEQGESDAVTWAAARKVILGYYQKLLATADEPSLRAYLQIRLDQLRAARKVSEEVCALLANSSLDVRQVLPQEHYERELTWVRSAIAASTQPPAPGVNPQRFGEIMKQLAERLSPEVPAVINDPAAHANQPQLLCRTTLEFYEAVRSLPLGERVIAVRGLFQSSAE